ncbi:MAG: hypothetical protein RBR77_07625 [Thauera sp.]|nr:hypothetical protein [Thauera sp.]
MTTYTATIAHNSISAARVITIDGTLTQAKRAATKEFGDGFLDHVIVIRDQYGEPVATRRIGDAKWA